MFRMSTLLLTTIMLTTAAFVRAQESPKSVSPLAPLKSLEGVWRGEGEGFWQTSRVTHRWETVLGGKFLRLTARSVSAGNVGATSVHDDVGYVSWSKSERTWQFLSEGFVNTLKLKQAIIPERGFNFESESTEGFENMAARMTLRFDQSGDYEMILELGTKGNPLKACQTMKLKNSQ